MENKKQKDENLQDLEHEILEKLVARFGTEKVEKWRREYAPRKLNIIEVEDKIAVLRPVTAAEVANFSMMTANAEIGLEKASRCLLSELWLDGDSEIAGDEDYFISAMLQLQRTVELKKSSFYRV
jgi:hypothetical protein